MRRAPNFETRYRWNSLRDPVAAIRLLFASFFVVMVCHTSVGRALGAEWSLEQYVAIGFPNLDHPWGEREYKDFRNAMTPLEITNRAALPRLGSGPAEAFFMRIADPKLAEILSDTTLGSEERASLFVTLFNLNPVWQRLYRPGVRAPVQPREAFALETTYLLMIKAAIHWDGRPLPKGPQDRTPFILRIGTLDNGYFGGIAYLTLDQMIPRLWNVAGLTDADRRRGAEVLVECLPTIWPFLRANHQSDIRDHLQSSYLRVRDPETKRQLKRLVDEAELK